MTVMPDLNGFEKKTLDDRGSINHVNGTVTLKLCQQLLLCGTYRLREAIHLGLPEVTDLQLIVFYQEGPLAQKLQTFHEDF
jgi:hypothetical protein